MERQEKEQKALDRWAELAGRNMKTDLQVNNLLEEIAGSKYIEDGDDPIWETIQSLSDDELEEFIDECDDIDECDRNR